MDADSYPRTAPGRPSGPLHPELSADELAEHDRVFGELAQRTRELMDAGMRTEVDHSELEQVSAAIAALTDRLRARALPGALGVQITENGERRNHGNAVVGLRNPAAPPLRIERYPDGGARASFRLGALHEGPPGLVHGGVSALILDQVLGEAAAAAGAPGMTGRLRLSYRRPTPLGDLSAEAWTEHVEGVKTVVTGRICDANGDPTVEAEGTFILPRWAREEVEQSRRPTTFE